MANQLTYIIAKRRFEVFECNENVTFSYTATADFPYPLTQHQDQTRVSEWTRSLRDGEKRKDIQTFEGANMKELAGMMANALIKVEGLQELVLCPEELTRRSCNMSLLVKEDGSPHKVEQTCFVSDEEMTNLTRAYEAAHAELR